VIDLWMRYYVQALGFEEGVWGCGSVRLGVWSRVRSGVECGVWSVE